MRLPNIEFGYVRHLQQDNSELRCLLEEHQAALQMIMTKYRQQVRFMVCIEYSTILFLIQTAGQVYVIVRA